MGTPLLYLIIQLGRDRYALEASQVTEIVPLVRLKALPGAPVGAAGLMNYRGTALPVVDLSLLATGTPTAATEAARIVVVRHVVHGRTSADDAFGLLVPEARDTVRLDPDSFVDPGVAADGAPYLGKVVATADGVLQRVTVRALLTDQLRVALSRATESA
jgi:chemotaxis-related protein WspB